MAVQHIYQKPVTVKHLTHTKGHTFIAALIIFTSTYCYYLSYFSEFSVHSPDKTLIKKRILIENTNHTISSENISNNAFDFSNFRLIALVLSGDIESNPGPSRNLKILSLNVNSLKSNTKKSEFKHMIDTVKPNIVAGCESKLDAGIHNKEVFPDCFTVYRKDRPLRANQLEQHGGGVFLLVRRELESTEMSFNNDIELVGCTVRLPNQDPLMILSYYRPHRNDNVSVEYLHNTLTDLHRHSSPNLVMLGDFNAPGLTWQSSGHTLVSSTATPSEKDLLNTLDTFGFTQYQLNPTRTTRTCANVLDLVLSNFEIIENTYILPGFSDHDAVACDLKLGIDSVSKKEKIIPMYKQANWKKFNSALLRFSRGVYFAEDPLSRTIEYNWCLIKNILTDLSSKYIPKRKIDQSKSNRCPWLTRKVKKALNQRNRAKRKALR